MTLKKGTVRNNTAKGGGKVVWDGRGWNRVSPSSKSSSSGSSKKSSRSSRSSSSSSSLAVGTVRNNTAQGGGKVVWDGRGWSKLGAPGAPAPIKETAPVSTSKSSSNYRVQTTTTRPEPFKLSPGNYIQNGQIFNSDGMVVGNAPAAGTDWDSTIDNSFKGISLTPGGQTSGMRNVGTLSPGASTPGFQNVGSLPPLVGGTVTSSYRPRDTNQVATDLQRNRPALEASLNPTQDDITNTLHKMPSLGINPGTGGVVSGGTPAQSAAAGTAAAGTAAAGTAAAGTAAGAGWIAPAAIAAGGAINAAGSAVAANTQADAETRAAQIQADAMEKARQLQESQFNTIREDWKPWRQAGETALKGIQSFETDNPDFGMTQFEKDPGYAFRIKEGMDALQNSAAARGGLLSGNTMKGITNYGQEAASQEYNNAYNRYTQQRGARLNRLQSLAGVGQSAIQQVNSAGQNYANNAGSAITGGANALANGMTGASSAKASGYTGTTNALNNALSSYINHNQSQDLVNTLRGGY